METALNICFLNNNWLKTRGKLYYEGKNTNKSVERVNAHIITGLDFILYDLNHTQSRENIGHLCLTCG